MPSFRGRPCCPCLAEWLPAYERELLDLGVIKRSIDVYQLIGAASASAGTHRSGGAFDLAQYSDKALWVARQMGAATWHRKPPAFIHHSHGVLKGCPHADPSAKRQVIECDAGGDGLVGSAADPGPRTGVQFPLRSWHAGMAWAKERQQVRGWRAKVKAKRAAIARLKGKIARAKR